MSEIGLLQATELLERALRRNTLSLKESQTKNQQTQENRVDVNELKQLQQQQELAFNLNRQMMNNQNKLLKEQTESIHQNALDQIVKFHEIQQLQLKKQFQQYAYFREFVQKTSADVVAHSVGAVGAKKTRTMEQKVKRSKVPADIGQAKSEEPIQPPKLEGIQMNDILELKSELVQMKQDMAKMVGVFVDRPREVIPLVERSVQVELSLEHDLYAKIDLPPVQESQQAANEAHLKDDSDDEHLPRQSPPPAPASHPKNQVEHAVPSFMNTGPSPLELFMAAEYQQKSTQPEPTATLEYFDYKSIENQIKSLSRNLDAYPVLESHDNAKDAMLQLDANDPFAQLLDPIRIQEAVKDKINNWDKENELAEPPIVNTKAPTVKTSRPDKQPSLKQKKPEKKPLQYIT